MKKINLIELLSDIDSKIIEDAYQLDNKEKIKMERRKKSIMKNNLFKWGSVCLGCICLVVAGVFIFSKNPKNNESVELLKIVNPVTEVSSTSEMKKYLGYDIPVIKDKKVEQYVVIGEDKIANIGRIIYSDESTFSMSKGSSDVSGILGGEFVKKQNLNNIEISIYKMENIIYATWNDKNYSYSYSMENSSIEKLVSEIELIK